MKTPEEITQDVLDGMIGIGGCPSNEEFYVEFDDRLRRALSIANVSVSLLEEAANLVGNPGTNISGSCDIACMDWQEKYERWRNER